MTHPPGLGHFTFRELPPAERIRPAGRTGFAAVGLRPCPAMPGGRHDALPPGSRALAETRAAMAGEGVSAHDVEAVVIDAAFAPEAVGPAPEQAAGVAALPPGMVRSARIRAAPAKAPDTMQARIAEARGRRLPPGAGGRDLAAAVRALPGGTVPSVERPMASDEPPGPRARRIFTATQASLARAFEGSEP